MTSQTSPTNPNATVRFLRKAYNPLGFSKGYNALLWFILAGAMTGFCLARAPYWAINTFFRENSGPGEWYYYSQKFYKVGITVHLASVIPAGLLAVLQFTPIVRRKWTLFHRMNGYTVALLVLLGNISALMIARHAFGGTLATQAFVGFLAIITTISLALAIFNIKRLQIEQHRACMLRLWAYLGSIITIRIIMVLTAIIVGRIGGYFIAIKCSQLAFAAGADAAAEFTACAADPGAWAAVEANLYDPKGFAEVIAAFQISFGMAGWVALAIHAVAVEVYLGLTPAEGERLRKLSYERRLERGLCAEKEES